MCGTTVFTCLQEKPADELRKKLLGAEVSCPTGAITVKD